MTLNLIVAALVTGVAVAGAADDDAKKKDKPAKRGKKGGIVTADTNQDGKISMDEMKAYGSKDGRNLNEKRIVAMFKRLDTDQDNHISMDELKAARKDRPGKKKGEEAGKGKKKGGAKDKEKDGSKDKDPS